MFEPPFYCNLLRIKGGYYANTLFTTFWAIKSTLKSIFYLNEIRISHIIWNTGDGAAGGRVEAVLFWACTLLQGLPNEVIIMSVEMLTVVLFHDFLYTANLQYEISLLPEKLYLSVPIKDPEQSEKKVMN